MWTKDPCTEKSESDKNCTKEDEDEGLTKFREHKTYRNFQDEKQLLNAAVNIKETCSFVKKPCGNQREEIFPTDNLNVIFSFVYVSLL